MSPSRYVSEVTDTPLPAGAAAEEKRKQTKQIKQPAIIALMNMKEVTHQV